MSFYSQKYALDPQKVDAVVDKVEATPSAANITLAVADIAALKAALPTTNPGAGSLWNDEGTIKMGTT